MHLDHLTPIHEAASRVAPHVPVIGHLHGTELLTLEQIAGGPPPGWTYADTWAARLRDWAHRCERRILVAGPTFVSARLTAAAYEHGLALAHRRLLWRARQE